MHILLARRIGKWTHAVGARQAVHGKRESSCRRTRPSAGQSMHLPHRQQPVALRSATRRQALARASWRVMAIAMCLRWCTGDADAQKRALRDGRARRSSRMRRRGLRGLPGQARHDAAAGTAAIELARKPAGPGQSMICCPVTQTVEPALYTVEGRQAGDLRRKCDSALIRKAKTHRAIVWNAVTSRRRPPTRRVRTCEGSRGVAS